MANTRKVAASRAPGPALVGLTTWTQCARRLTNFEECLFDAPPDGVLRGHA